MKDIPSWITAAIAVSVVILGVTGFYFNSTFTAELLDIKVSKLEDKVEKLEGEMGILKTAILTNSNEVKHLVDTQEEVRLTLKELSLELREVHDAVLLLAKTSAGGSPKTDRKK